MLLDWNKRINLISRKEENVIERHFLDSILFLPEINNVIARRCEAPTKQSDTKCRPESLTRDLLSIRQEILRCAQDNASHWIASVASLPRNDKIGVLDIGSGGGFPAIPLAIMKPDWHFTLCESTGKKANFLECVTKELGLKNTKVINGRVEAIHELPLQKTKFDIVTARAVAKLDILIKDAMPVLKKGGYLVAYKAKDIDEELKGAEKLIKKNNLTLKIFSKEINDVERNLVVLSHPRIL